MGSGRASRLFSRIGTYNRLSTHRERVESVIVKRRLHRCTIPLRWGDMDAMGHVNNTVYFRFMEQARVEWLSLNSAAFVQGVDAPVIVSAGCVFMKPITYPGVMQVDMSCVRIGGSSFDTEYEIRVAGEVDPAALGTARVVWTSVRTGRSVQIPTPVREKLEAAPEQTDGERGC